MRLLGPLGAIALLFIVVVFAIQNDFEKVRVNFGFMSFDRVPVSLLAIVGLIVGMFLMLLVGIESDLKVRAILRERLKEEAKEEDVMEKEEYQGIKDSMVE